MSRNTASPAVLTCPLHGAHPEPEISQVVHDLDARLHRIHLQVAWLPTTRCPLAELTDLAGKAPAGSYTDEEIAIAYTLAGTSPGPLHRLLPCARAISVPAA